MAEMPFVGDERRRLVDGLADAFGDVRTRARPRLVTLEAASGSGKSRVMRELYRCLAREHQTDPVFWPMELERSEDPDEDIDARRKHISAGLVVAEPQAEPQWFWWGVSVTDQRYVRPLQALKQDRGQITTLAEVLSRRLPPSSGVRRKVDAFVQRERALQGLASVAVGETISTAAAMIGVPVPGASVAQWVAERYRAVRRDRRGREEAVRVSMSGPHADHFDRLVEELAPKVSELSTRVPFVIAIEDVHRADAALVDLLLSILHAPVGKVLVIATAWPGLLDDQQRDVARLLRDVAEDRVTRYRHDDFPPLTLDDRITLTTTRLADQRARMTRTGDDGCPVPLPPIDDAACKALAERYTTPLAIEQVCGLRSVRLLIERGRLDVHEVEALPEDDPAQIYTCMWEELDQKLRRVLEVCALTTPSAQSPVLTSDAWAIDLALRAGARAGLFDTPVEPDTISAIAGLGWIHRVSRELWCCTEPPQFRVAREQAARDIPAVLVEDLRAAIVEEITAGTTAPRDFREALVVGLALAGALPWRDEDLRPLEAGDRLLFRAATFDEVSQLTEARDVGREMLRSTSPTKRTPDAAWITRAATVAELTGRCGNAGAAAQQLEDMLREFDHPDTDGVFDDLALRHAFWLGEAGHLDAATDGLRRIIARCEVLDPAPPQLTEARVALAAWLGDEARPLEAVALLQQVLDDPSEPLVSLYDRVAVEQQLAYWYGESGATASALARLERIEQDLAGQPWPAALVLQSVRQQRGHWLGIRGASVEAETLLAELERQRTERIGPGHPDTLSTRNQRWSWAARRGAVHEGVMEYRRLARDRMRTLGPEAPPVHGTRNNLAVMLIEAGAYDEAATILDDVTRRMAELFTPTHRSAILARANLANLIGILGDAGGALEGLQEAHAAWHTRHLRGTRDELAMRGNISVWLDATGATAEAMGLLTATLSEQQQRLDVDDPDTLISAANLAFLRDREEAGEPVRTRAAAKDLDRVLGESAPESMTAWHNVGHLLLSSGDILGAQEVLTRVLERRTLVLGAEHPDTRVTAAELDAARC